MATSQSKPDPNPLSWLSWKSVPWNQVAAVTVWLLAVVALLSMFWPTFGYALLERDFYVVQLAEKSPGANPLLLSIRWDLALGSETTLRVTNFVLYVVAGCLLLLWLRALLVQPAWEERYKDSLGWIALAATLLWWFHPIHQASVAMIANRDTLLLAIGTFGCLWTLCMTRIRPESWLWILAATAFAWLSVAVSPAGAIILGQLIVCDLLLQETSSASRIKKRVTMYGLTATSLFCLLLPGVQFPSDDFMIAERHWSQLPLLLSESIQHWLWPPMLRFDYLRPANQATATLWIGWLVMLGMLGIGLFLARRLLIVRLWLIFALVGCSSFLALSAFDGRPELLSDARMLVLSACLAGVMATLLYELGRWCLAEKLTVPVLMTSCAVACLCLIGVFGQQLKNYRSTNALWSSVLESAPYHPRAHQRLGASSAANGDNARAIEHYQQSLQLWPQRAATHNALGAEFVEQQRWSDAENSFRQALSLDKEFALARQNLANLLMRQGDFTAAERQYRRLVEQQPESAELRLLLGSCYMRFAQFPKAAEQLRLAVKYNPDSAVAHCNLGSVSGASGDLAGAKKHLLKAIELRPTYAEAHYNLAAILEMDFKDPNRVQNAWNHVQKAIQLNPNYLDARLKLSSWHFQASQYSKSLEHLLVALEVAPTNAVVHDRLGIVYSELKQEAKAMEHFRKVIELRPNSFQAVLELGWRLAALPDAKLRDGEEAVRLAKELGITRQPNSPQMWDLIGAGYAEQRRFDEAIEAAGKAINFAVEMGDQELALNIQYRLMLYQQGQVFRTSDFATRRQASNTTEKSPSTY